MHKLTPEGPGIRPHPLLPKLKCRVSGSLFFVLIDNPERRYVGDHEPERTESHSSTAADL
jgi:hypothetical protein